MSTKYNVVKEEKLGNADGEIVATFSKGRKAEEFAAKAQIEDSTNLYNYFVQTDRTL